MEQARPDPSAEPSTKLEAKPTVARNERVHERYAWVILTADVALGILSALTTTLPPLSWFSDPLYSTTYSVMGAWGISWVSFEILALVVILIPFRRARATASTTPTARPGLWLCLFVL